MNEKIKLEELIEKTITGEWGTDLKENEIGTKVIRTADFNNDGTINYDKVVSRNIENKKILKAAALLHDTLEDTYTSYKELVDNFGEAVASIVLELTTAKYGSKLIGKAQYLAEKMQFMTNYALFIKLADRLDNLSDMKGCTEEKKERTVNDTIYILDYLEKRRTLTKSQQKLATAIKEQIEIMIKRDNINIKTVNEK